MILTFFLLSLFLFVVRGLMVINQPRSFDNWGHLYYVSVARAQKKGPFSSFVPNTATGGEFYYPLLMHWLVSFIPEKIIERFDFYIMPFFESLFVFISCFVLHQSGVSIHEISIIVLMYAFIPLCFSKVSLGPMVGFTTRRFSEFLGNLIVLLLLIETPNMYVYSALVVAILLIIAGSKFGIQFVLLVFLPLVTVMLRLDFLVCIIAAFMLSVLLSRGVILETWKEQYRHLSWYLQKTISGDMPMSKRNSIENLKSSLRKDTLFEKVLGVVFYFFARNSFTAVILKAPLIIFLLVIFFSSEFSGFHWIFLVSILVFFLTNTKYFIVIGEAERYIQHVLFSYVVWFVTHFGVESIELYLVVLFGVLYYLGELYLLGVKKIGQPIEDGDSALERIYELTNGDEVILSYPYHVLPPWRLLFETKYRPIFPIVGSGSEGELLKSYEKYPFIDLKFLKNLSDRFSLSVIVVQDNKISEEETLMLTELGWVKDHATCKGISIYMKPS